MSKPWKSSSQIRKQDNTGRVALLDEEGKPSRVLAHSDAREATVCSPGDEGSQAVSDPARGDLLIHLGGSAKTTAGHGVWALRLAQCTGPGACTLAPVPSPVAGVERAATLLLSSFAAVLREETSCSLPQAGASVLAPQASQR